MGSCSSCTRRSQSHPHTPLPVLPLADPSVGEVRTIGRGVSRRGSTFVQAAEITDKTLPTGVTTGMHTVSPLREGFDPMQLGELEGEDAPVSPRLQRQLSKRGADDPPIDVEDLDRPSLGPRKPSERSSLKRQPTKIDFEDEVVLPVEPPEELQPLKLVVDLATPRLADEALELQTVARNMDESERQAESISDEAQCLELLKTGSSDTNQLLLVRGILLCSKWETNETVMLAGYDEFLRLCKKQALMDWMAEWGLVLGLIDFAINPVFGHLKSGAVQAKFCAVLAMLCERLGDEGVLQLNKSVHALIMALRYHPHELGVQKYGLIALASVVRGDSNAESQTNQFLVVAKGGIELVCDALSYFTVEGPKQYKPSSEQEAVPPPNAPSREECRALQTAGVAALCVFSNNPTFHHQMIEAHAVEIVLEAMRHHGEFLPLKIRSVVFMHNMCEKGEAEVIKRIWQSSNLELPTLLSEAPEEKDLDEGMRQELAVLRHSLETTLGNSSSSSSSSSSMSEQPLSTSTTTSESVL